MTDVCRELCDVVEMPDLSGGVLVRCRRQGEGQWLVVGNHVEVTPFHKVSEVLDCKIHRQKFAIERTITGLSWAKFLREVRDRLPVPIDLLLQDGTDCCV